MTGGHLTDEQIAELLAGDTTDSGTPLHLLACEVCRRELAEMKGATADFNDLSLAWARLQAPHRIPPPSRFALYLGGRPAWGMGLAATVTAILMAVGFPLTGVHPHRAEPRSAGAVPSHAELAEDNRLMESIDQELQYEAAPVIPASELRVTARRREARAGMAVLN